MGLGLKMTVGDAQLKEFGYLGQEDHAEIAEYDVTELSAEKGVWDLMKPLEQYRRHNLLYLNSSSHLSAQS